MKNLLIIFLVITSCKSFKSNEKDKIKDSNILSTYNIYKIDSINNYYLIYVMDEKYRYKIVSKKMTIYNCDEIKIDSSYSFHLKLLSNISKPTGNEKFIPVNYLHLERCVQLDNETTICT